MCWQTAGRNGGGIGGISRVFHRLRFGFHIERHFNFFHDPYLAGPLVVEP
jgi:hypothetical protein